MNFLSNSTLLCLRCPVFRRGRTGRSIKPPSDSERLLLSVALPGRGTPRGADTEPGPSRVSEMSVLCGYGGFGSNGYFFLAGPSDARSSCDPGRTSRLDAGFTSTSLPVRLHAWEMGADANDAGEIVAVGNALNLRK